MLDVTRTQTVHSTDRKRQFGFRLQTAWLALKPTTEHTDAQRAHVPAGAP